jgi:LPS export ABC transporter permease LptG/LPS export ABC transporter permease LptF
VKTLDRYLIRETIPPFLLSLGLFTFLFAVRPMLEQARDLLAAGVDLPTVGWLLLWLLPQALGITIPMAFMAGILMGLGRLSGDRESVAFLACGVSPMRLLRPVLLVALLAGAADMYCLVRLVPDWNQRFRETTFRILLQNGKSDIKPGLIYEGFPQKVLHIQEVNPNGGWRGVMLADTSEMNRPVLTLASEGYLDTDEAKRQVAIVLPGESVRYEPGAEAGVYNTSRARDVRLTISADSVFGSGDLNVGRGLPEMTIADLRQAEAQKRAVGLSPHPEILQRHQMFSFPVACVVFALLGVALGLHTRKEGKLGGFTLGIAAIFVYYAVMMVFESLVKGGRFPAEWARWMPNIVLGVIAIVALRWRATAHGRELSFRLPAWGRFLRPRTSLHASSPDVTSSPSSPKGRERIVVVIRVPRMSMPLPTPRILDLYIARKYLSVTMLSFVALLGLYYIGTLIDKSERLSKNDATLGMLFEFLYLSTPQFVAYVVPMAALVAALASVGALTRSGELVVMRACGVSIYRAALPILAIALIWSGGLFYLDDRVLAHANRQAEALDDAIRGTEPHTVNIMANANWLVDRKNGRIYHYAAFHIPSQTLHELSVFTVIPQPYRLIEHTHARRVVFDGTAWQASEGWVQRFPTPDRVTRTSFSQRTMDLLDPERFSGMHNEESELMTLRELREYVNDQEGTGFRAAASRVQMHARIAFPLVTIVMTLIGVPFGVTMGRRGALYGIGVALILGCAYWLVNAFFTAAGQADVLPAALAAWAANLLFLALAGYATMTVRT